MPDEFDKITLDLEEVLLASLMFDWVDKHWDEEELRELRPQHFLRETNGTIFQTILDLHSREGACDFLNVARELYLKKPKLFQAIGGMAYFHMLAMTMRDHAMSCDHLRAWAKAVRQNYAIRSGKPIIEKAKNHSSITDGGVEI